MTASGVFDATKLIDRLARFGHTLPAVVRCFSESDARWRPDEQSWSALEIVCHMGDEEIEDFRPRVLMTLDDPSKDWPPIDPQGWAIDREYQSKDLKAELNRFVEARAESIELIHALKDPDWSRFRDHPRFGPMIAGDLLAAWCAHDALHLRQLAKRLHQLAQRDVAGGTIRYAGDW